MIVVYNLAVEHLSKRIKSTFYSSENANKVDLTGYFGIQHFIHKVDRCIDYQTVKSVNQNSKICYSHTARRKSE